MCVANIGRYNNDSCSMSSNHYKIYDKAPDAVFVCPDKLVQAFRTIAGCPYSGTQHSEGYHSSFKVTLSLEHNIHKQYTSPGPLL
jgi:hypothetical protein